MQDYVNILRDEEQLFDEALSALPCFKGAEELSLSPLLSQDFILAKKYIDSFRHHAFVVSGGSSENDRYLLSPTCCYPVFSHLVNSTLSDRYLVTHKNTCFRSEKHYEPGVRQSSFLMREYILLTTQREDVDDWIAQVKKNVLRMLEKVGVSARIEKAYDPFFKVGDVRQKFQEAVSLKSEFIVNDVAVASVNFHLKSFSKSCRIRTSEGSWFYSACFGLGYDRLQAMRRRSLERKIA